MKAFFVAYGGGHVTMVAPVVRALQARGVECRVLALTTAFSKARNMGLAPLRYRDFETLVRDREQVLAWGRALESGNRHPDVEAHESHLYLGINFAQWVRDLGEEGAWRAYEERGRHGFLPIEFLTDVLRLERPDVLVTTNAPRSEQAAVEAAGRLGIPSLSMYDVFLSAGDPYCLRRHHADRITVLSPAVKHAMVEGGIEPGRIAVTGNPAFDTLRSPDVLAAAKVLRDRLGWQQRRVILFAGGSEPASARPEWQGVGLAMQVESRLRTWVAAHSSDALVLRYHPSESHLFPRGESHACIHRSEPSMEALHPVLLASDVVVVQNSTVGLEAALSGRRVLCLDFAPSVLATSFNYVDLGLAESVKTVADLSRALADDSGAVRVDPSDYCIGEATQRVADEAAGLGGLRG